MIEVITTGGTIDKVYNPISGTFEFTVSCIEDIIINARINSNLKVTHLFAKDSLDMTDKDRMSILQYLQKSDSNKILIAHGTDSMVNSAKTLSVINNKVVVLFGAMVPYSVTKSDAVFNFSYAYSVVNYLKNGIYIAMGGEIFTYDKVVKNKQFGVFKKL